ELLVRPAVAVARIIGSHAGRIEVDPEPSVREDRVSRDRVPISARVTDANTHRVVRDDVAGPDAVVRRALRDDDPRSLVRKGAAIGADSDEIVRHDVARRVPFLELDRGTTTGDDDVVIDEHIRSGVLDVDAPERIECPGGRTRAGDVGAEAIADDLLTRISR